MDVIVLNGKPFALGYMPIVSTSNYVHNFGCWIKSWLTSLANMSKDCHLKFQIWSRDVKIVRDWWKDSRFFLLLVRSHVHAFPTVLILSLERSDVTSKTTSHTKMHEQCSGSHYITNRDIDHNKFIDVFSFEMSRCMHWWQGIVFEPCMLLKPTSGLYLNMQPWSRVKHLFLSLMGDNHGCDETTHGWQCIFFSIRMWTYLSPSRHLHHIGFLQMV